MSLLTNVFGGTKPSACLSREEAVSLVEDRIPAGDIEKFRAHLTDCASCRRTVEDVICRNSPHQPLATPIRETDTGFTRMRDQLIESDSSAAPDPMLDAPAKSGELGMIGQYRVLRVLGQGGMGIVYQGFDPRLKRSVAIKLLRREPHDLRARKRFVRESRAAAGIQHDHVVTVYSVANPKDAPPYLVMQYIPGQSVRERIANDKRLSPRLAAKVAMQVAKGLAAAHATGLVHRDVKPGNIMLDESDNRAKLTDFGLVRATESEKGITQEGFTPGTPEYMSPEQFTDSNEIDARSDVYSLGVTLYEMLTGTVPFRGASHQIMQQVLHDVPPRPRRLNAVIPRDLETICLRAIEKDPARRYASAREMERDLHRWLRGKPIKARPVGAFGKLLRWRKRQPATAHLAASLVLLVIASFAAIFWQWRRAEHNLAEYRKQQTETERHVVASRQHRKQRIASEQEAKKQATRADKAQGQIIEVALQSILRQDNSPRAIQSKFTKQLFAITREAIANGDGRESNRLNVAAAHLCEGNVWLEANKNNEAIAAYERALEKYSALEKDDSGNESVRHGLAATRHWLGVAQSRVNRPIDALANHEAAAKSFEELARANPDARNYPLDTVQSLIAIARLSPIRSTRRSTLEKARGILLTVQQKVGKVFDLMTQQAVILSYRNLADAHRQLGEHEQAITLLRLACNLAEGMMDRSPKASPFRGELAASLNSLGEFLLEIERPTEAIKEFQKAVAHQRIITARNVLQRDPRATEAKYLGNLAIAFRQSGSFREAIATTKKRSELVGWDAESLYACGSEIASCIAGLDGQNSCKPDERAEFADLAIEMLRRAIDIGFRKDRLKNDPALAVLHAHPDFPSLLTAKPRKRWKRPNPPSSNARPSAKRTPKSRPRSSRGVLRVRGAPPAGIRLAPNG